MGSPTMHTEPTTPRINPRSATDTRRTLSSAVTARSLRTE
jgi:hypothetical protein